MYMADKVSTMEVRQRIGDMLNRVALRHDEFIIERKGQPLAALVPVERLDQMRRFARRHALAVMEQQHGGGLTDGQAMALGLEAERWARRRKRRPQIKVK
jgi:prevent-host-death family protein